LGDPVCPVDPCGDPRSVGDILALLDVPVAEGRPGCVEAFPAVGERLGCGDPLGPRMDTTPGLGDAGAAPGKCAARFGEAAGLGGPGMLEPDPGMLGPDPDGVPPRGEGATFRALISDVRRIDPCPPGGGEGAWPLARPTPAPGVNGGAERGGADEEADGM